MSFSVSYHGLSNEVHLKYSVPRGSVLGPLLFILYTANLSDLAATFNVKLHAYADDTQLYFHCKPDTITPDTVANLENCITAISNWMSANRLKLNPSKAELLWVGSRNRIRKLQNGGPNLSVGGASISPASSVRLLGVTVTPDLQHDKHVTSVSATCFYQLRQLRRIRHSLDRDSVGFRNKSRRLLSLPVRPSVTSVC